VPVIADRWLTDDFTLEIVKDWPDPALALAVILSEGSTRAPDGVHRPDMLAVNHVDNPTSPAHDSWDLGIWQLNSYWHNVGDVVAYNPFLSSDYAFKISAGGTNFGAWIGYTSGGYKKHLPRAQAAWAAFPH
jgi:hypothetical protein